MLMPRDSILERLTNFLTPFFGKNVVEMSISPKCPFLVNVILETVTIRMFVNMASIFRKLRFFVKAILDTVTIRIFVNMAHISP